MKKQLLILILFLFSGLFLSAQESWSANILWVKKASENIGDIYFNSSTDLPFYFTNNTSKVEIVLNYTTGEIINKYRETGKISIRFDTPVRVVWLFNGGIAEGESIVVELGVGAILLGSIIPVDASGISEPIPISINWNR